MSQEQEQQGERGGCGCGCAGATPESAAPVDAAAAQTAQDEPEKRKGFHPALVAATIVVVVFVLWFCPWALMRARAAANEAAAAAVLESGKYMLMKKSRDKLQEFLKSSRMSNDLQDLVLVARNFQVAEGVSENGAKMVCFAPRYYGRTATRTFCLYRGKVYAKDLGQQLDPTREPVPLDKSWTPVSAAPAGN